MLPENSCHKRPHSDPGRRRQRCRGVEDVLLHFVLDDLAKSLLICTGQEMIDKLVPYAELGIDRLILSPNLLVGSEVDP